MRTAWAVGGTMLLVDAALHRGGLNFPEIPYRFLLETEGFAALANDLGVVPLLPGLKLHIRLLPVGAGADEDRRHGVLQTL